MASGGREIDERTNDTYSGNYLDMALILLPKGLLMPTVVSIWKVVFF